MNRPTYLSKYLFDWELLDVVVGGKSALDSKFFVGQMYNVDQVNQFLKGYGLDASDPVSRAELFGNFQEALQFIKRYFLKEGTPDGLDLTIPNSIYMITDISDLFLLATGNKEGADVEETLWAEVILKVIHTILHTDKDLRSNYFNIIQTQIFDRFYKYLYRDKDNKLFLGVKGKKDGLPLIEFETKSKKTRDSVIIKLLHKAENVAEELFDRVGVRFITNTKFDTIRVVKFLLENNIIIPHNIKPSRSINTVLDTEKFKVKHNNLIKMAIRNNLSEERFLQAIEREANECQAGGGKDDKNKHSLADYQSLQFTCRQLIKYKNPFLYEFNELRKMAKERGEDPELAKKILGMDVSLIARDIRFFYPYELQIVDLDSHNNNTSGEASHIEYKKSQVVSARNRVFKTLIEYKNLNS
ncbi:MAG: hypothetical protein CME70_06775 [Halobacteriovorax sp.]|nr:hypothetical protein [Halobacteriovorax sp.]|tara:strand:+ start:497939 stop:499180 length:1242 start_codon:yes stop_codon:yes gene_type:complete